MCCGLSRRTPRARVRCAVNGKGPADVSHYFELLVSRRSSSPLDDSSSKKNGGPHRGEDAGTSGFVTMDERPWRDPRASTVRPEEATPWNRGIFTASKRGGAGWDRHRNASSLSHGRHVRG